MSFKDYFGIQESALPKLATGFGGGIGLHGSLCGSLTGAIIAIGMRSGRTNPKDRETASKVYEKCRQFMDRFEKEFGKKDCFSLTGGYHLDNPEESKKWAAAGGREKCTDIVEKTAQMLCQYIE